MKSLSNSDVQCLVSHDHEKGGRLALLSITSELDRFKRCYTQNALNHRGFGISVPDRISRESVKHLQHLVAVLSNTKHTDCGFFGHDKKEKVWGKKCKELGLSFLQ